MRQKFLITLFCAVLTASSVFAQNVQELTYERSLELALRNGYTFKQQENTFRSSYFLLKASEAALRSNARMDISLPAYDVSIKEQYNFATQTYQFINSQQLKFQVDARINQPIKTGGGNFSINGTLAHIAQETPGIQPDHPKYRKSDRYFGRLYVEFEQPILQPNELKNDVEESEMDLQRTRYSYSQRKSFAISWLAGSFYDLFRFQNQIDLKEVLSNQYESAYRNARTRVAAGTLDKRELLNLEVDLTNLQTDLLKLVSDRQNREATFMQSIGMSLDSEIKAVADLSILPLNITLEDAIKRGLENRVEISRYALDIREQEIDIEEIKADGRITAELKVTFGFDNSIDGELFRNSFYEPLRDIFRNYDRSRSVILTFKMPILDWGRNAARLQEEFVSLERTKNAQINTSKDIQKEITDAYYTLQETKDRLVITRSAHADAKRIYELTLTQFNRNEVTSQDLRLAKDRYISSDDFSLNAYVEYQKAVVNLNSKTMWDFQNDISFVTEEEMNSIILSTTNDNNNNN